MLKNTGKTHFNSTVTIQRFQKRSPERKIRGDRSKTLFHGEVGEQKSCQVSLLQSGKFRQVYKRCAKDVQSPEGEGRHKSDKCRAHPSPSSFKTPKRKSRPQDLTNKEQCSNFAHKLCAQ